MHIKPFKATRSVSSAVITSHLKMILVFLLRVFLPESVLLPHGSVLVGHYRRVLAASIDWHISRPIKIQHLPIWANKTHLINSSLSHMSNNDSVSMNSNIHNGESEVQLRKTSSATFKKCIFYFKNADTETF